MKTLPFKELRVGKIYTLPPRHTRYIKLHPTVSYNTKTGQTTIHDFGMLCRIVGTDRSIANNPDAYSHYIQSLMSDVSD